MVKNGAVITCFFVGFSFQLYCISHTLLFLTERDGKTHFSLSQRPATPKTPGPQPQSLQERILHDCCFGSPSPQVPRVHRACLCSRGFFTLNNPTPASDPSPHPQPTPAPLWVPCGAAVCIYPGVSLKPRAFGCTYSSADTSTQHSFSRRVLLLASKKLYCTSLG